MFRNNIVHLHVIISLVSRSTRLSFEFSLIIFLFKIAAVRLNKFPPGDKNIWRNRDKFGDRVWNSDPHWLFWCPACRLLYFTQMLVLDILILTFRPFLVKNTTLEQFKGKTIYSGHQYPQKANKNFKKRQKLILRTGRISTNFYRNVPKRKSVKREQMCNFFLMPFKILSNPQYALCRSKTFCTNLYALNKSFAWIWCKIIHLLFFGNNARYRKCSFKLAGEVFPFEENVQTQNGGLKKDFKKENAPQSFFICQSLVWIWKFYHTVGGRGSRRHNTMLESSTEIRRKTLQEKPKSTICTHVSLLLGLLSRTAHLTVTRGWQIVAWWIRTNLDAWVSLSRRSHLSRLTWDVDPILNVEFEFYIWIESPKHAILILRNF